jgi:geranylgeranyl pyrophosphate synthase
VYGFGVMIGKIFADIFGLNNEEAKRTTDWCGRFNLGISLFDYICDEMDGVSSVSSLEVFKLFLNSSDSIDRSLTPAEKLLSDLAGSVLDDLKRVSVKGKNVYEIDQLFKAMMDMFEAENFISKETLSANADLKKIGKTLYYKSAEPFRVMAAFTVLAMEGKNEAFIRNAYSAGKALGYCYWLIDDAKDVWDDLKSGRWNLFLAMAVAEEPQFFSSSHADTEGQLMEIWKRSDHAENISIQTIKRLVNAVKRLDLSENVRHHSLGLVWASLWQWSKY